MIYWRLLLVINLHLFYLSKLQIYKKLYKIYKKIQYVNNTKLHFDVYCWSTTLICFLFMSFKKDFNGIVSNTFCVRIMGNVSHLKHFLLLLFYLYNIFLWVTHLYMYQAQILRKNCYCRMTCYEKICFIELFSFWFSFTISFHTKTMMISSLYKRNWQLHL